MRESPSRKHLGVAVVTTGRNLGAAGHRIPRRVGPLYPGLQSHGLTLREDAPLTRIEAESTTQRSDRTGSRSATAHPDQGLGRARFTIAWYAATSPASRASSQRISCPMSRAT